MTTQTIALASQFAGLPAIQDIAARAGEPSGLAVMLVALATLIAGRLLGGRPGSAYQD